MRVGGVAIVAPRAARYVELLPASRLTADLDHPDFDRGGAALEHFEFLRDGLADVEHAPAHVGAAVRHLGVDEAAVLEVADFDEGPEREGAVCHRGLVHAEGALVGHQLALMELAIPAGLPALAYRELGGGDRGHGNGAQQARKGELPSLSAHQILGSCIGWPVGAAWWRTRPSFRPERGSTRIVSGQMP